jgi:hypothetical protein
VNARLDELLDSLVYEGYALYPYTPQAVKNATPTPFGIVYPPGYARLSAATFDHLRLECELEEPAPVSAAVVFLQWDGEGHSAEKRRVELDRPGGLDFVFPPLRGRIVLEVEGTHVCLRVENESPFAGGERSEALPHSFLSTHPLVHAEGGRFRSPLEAEGFASVNTWPVLATPGNDVVLGAAIVLPDHPQIAPQSRGSLYDGTEIEEALLLHVHALSDEERLAIEEGDPAVREMVARAAATTPADILRLHGLMRPVEEPPGEKRVEVDGVTFALGGRLRLRPDGGADAYDLLLTGRTATIERIYVDYDDGVHLGVTVDDDPGRELMRESGRFLFFKPHEVEVLA